MLIYIKENNNNLHNLTLSSAAYAEFVDRKDIYGIINSYKQEEH
jgi:hypothetical protein